MRDLLAIAGEPGWDTVTIPDATPPVRVWRLHYDQLTRASVSLVSFPPGWNRPGAGRYLAGEEFVLLRGSIAMNGHQFRAGEWVWVAPGASRTATSTVTGALALAWFDRAPRWRPAQAGDGTGGRQHRRQAVLSGRMARPGAIRPGYSSIVDGRLEVDPVADRDLLTFPAWHWSYVPAGSQPSIVDGGQALVRRWSREPAHD